MSPKAQTQPKSSPQPGLDDRLWKTPFVGHRDLLSQIDRLIIHSQMPATVLFYGSGGVGKRYLLAEVAERILSHSLNQSTGEQAKLEIATRLRAGHHRDLWIAPPSLPALLKEHADSLQAHLSLRSLNGGPRVVVVPEIERFRDGRINQLLKTLEEPAPGTYILLSSSRKSSLLPTLISRCFLWHVPSLDLNDFTTVLRREADDDLPIPESPSELENLWRRCRGSCGEALFQLQHRTLIEQLREILLEPHPLEALKKIDALTDLNIWSTKDFLGLIERALNLGYNEKNHGRALSKCLLSNKIAHRASLHRRRQLLDEHHYLLKRGDLPLQKNLFLKSLITV